MEKISGIYCIENLVNGKKYIGQSTNICKRLKSHISDLSRREHSNKYLQNSWDKYGEDNFDFYMLEFCDIDLLDDREIFYINLLKTQNEDYGYNLANGGRVNRGWKFTEDQRRHMSEAHIGKRLSDSCRQHMCESHRRAIELGLWKPCIQQLIEVNEKQKVPINCYDRNGDLINTYASIHDASRDLNLEATNISKCLVGKHKTCGNFIFYYIDYHPTLEEIKQRFKIENCKPKIVLQVDKCGNIINEFESIKKCFDSQKYYDNYDAVKSQCRGKVKSKIDYVYIYKHLYDPQKLEKYFTP